jgi:hypothetical protein
MTIKGILLAGASLCTLGAGTAFANTSAPKFHVTAMRPGAARVVAKTSMHKPAAGHLTYTFGVYTYVSTASAYKTKTNLVGTFYKWNSSYSICTSPKMKVKLASKKTAYAKLSTGTTTYSLGCSTPTKFYGDVYDLQTKSAAGSTDTFTSDLIGHFKSSGSKITGNLYLDVSVSIGS